MHLGLWAISDLHLSHGPNRTAFDDMPSFPDDWLILAGDVGDRPEHLEYAFRVLTSRFQQIVWVPGNHDLWTLPTVPDALRGQALYERLVELARGYGVLTPEDPYPIIDHATGPLQIAPLFLLYDYSFRPRNIAEADVLAWASEAACLSTDEALLHPDPYPSRTAWCAARCAQTKARLAACDPSVRKILVNHFPLRSELAVLPLAPRFTPWCGTRQTEDWHQRFNAAAVVFGHLHIRRTTMIDNVPFQEVSLGYPRQWSQERGIGAYLRQVVLRAT